MIFCSSLSSAQLKVFIDGLFSFNQDIPAFKEHLRDFLVQIRVSGFLLQRSVFADKCNSILALCLSGPQTMENHNSGQELQKISYFKQVFDHFQVWMLGQIEYTTIFFSYGWMHVCGFVGK